MAQDDLARGMARADLCRFLAACYYQPGPEFAEEKLFDSMQAAASRVNPDFAAGARRLGEAFADTDPEVLLIDYTRLFLGPVDTLAKPYGSIWLRRDNTLMEESTSAVQQLYVEGGFDIDDGFRELPDHVAAELEFLYLLIFRETEAQGKGDVVALAATSDLRRRFLAAHLGAWVRPFTAAVAASAQTAFYRELAELTARFVELEAEGSNALPG
jgi:TorA maturation chaperone TorD